MQLKGGISYFEKGITQSIRAMHVQSELIAMTNENVTGFDKVGFQRKEPVVSSFTEYLGVHGLSQTVDDQTGRIKMSDNPLDIALANKGYFQVQYADGIKLTRDGRFKIDKEGWLLNLEDANVLSNAGTPIKLHIVPDDLKEIKINDKGLIQVFNKTNNKLENVAFMGVVDSNGMVVMDPQVKQGYNEFSNVSLQNEFISMVPMIRNFEANRQLLMIQNQNLQKAISQLGQA